MTKPLAFVNAAIPAEALRRLASYAEVVPFATSAITYPPLSGHADLFLCPSPLPGQPVVAAPNIPIRYTSALSHRHIHYIHGITPVDSSLQGASAYNAALSPGLSILRPDCADPSLPIPEGSRIIPVRQGLCRCAALILDAQHVITSDGGIAKALRHLGIQCLLVDHHPILLPGYRSGCFGGCCGIHGQRLFLIGSLRHHPQGAAIRTFLAHTPILDLVELYPGPLFDAGSIVFIDQPSTPTPTV